MNPLEMYLATHFVDLATLCTKSGQSESALQSMISAEMIPGPSYTIANCLTSLVFGSMPTLVSSDATYFAPSVETWIARAIAAIDEVGFEHAAARLRQTFANNYGRAIELIHRTLWPVADLCDGNGTLVHSAFESTIDTVWKHFLGGTFGLCVVDASDEMRIARKETAQSRLVVLTDNGQRKQFSTSLAADISALQSSYAALCMPFSPVEYSRSSRKRLVDDLHIVTVE
jgi:hypothetical protein